MTYSPTPKTINRILNAEHVMQDDGYASVEQIILAATASVIEPGTVLGQITEGSQTVTPTAKVGNTGTGSIGTVTADADAIAGRYVLTIIEPATDAGTFVVERPNGIQDGTGKVAVAYNGMINFTLADATDFVAGDQIYIDVAYAAANQWAKLDLTANNGAEIAKGILFDRRGINAGTQRGVAHVRRCTVNGKKIFWPAGITTDQKAAAIVQLAGPSGNGVLVR